MQSLVPCPSCKRHVGAAEGACPFCGAALPSDLGSTLVPAVGPPGLSRSAKLALASSLVAAALVAGCDGETVTPVYGAPCAPPEDCDASSSSGQGGAGGSGGAEGGGGHGGAGGMSGAGGAGGAGGHG